MALQSKSFIRNVINGIKSRFIGHASEGLGNLNLGWFQVKMLKHLPAGPRRTHRMLDKEIVFTSPGEFLHGLNELFIHQIYKIELPENAKIIDCGANIGLSVLYFKTICPTANIIAFEPDENNFQLLQMNSNALNDASISLHQKAVWIKDGTISFSSNSSMSSKISENEISDAIVEIPCVQLSSFLQSTVDLLKIDIEGAEYEVLKNIQGQLPQVENMFLEYHGDFSQNNELCEIFDIIKNAGFKFYIKEAADVYPTPFYRKGEKPAYDVQLNIFCFRN